MYVINCAGNRDAKAAIKPKNHIKYMVAQKAGYHLLSVLCDGGSDQFVHGFLAVTGAGLASHLTCHRTLVRDYYGANF